MGVDLSGLHGCNSYLERSNSLSNCALSSARRFDACRSAQKVLQPVSQLHHPSPPQAQQSNSPMAKIWSSHGRSAHSALRPILRLSSLKRVALLAKPSASANHAMFAKNALNTRSRMMSVSVFGVASLSVSAVASSAVLHKAHSLLG